MSLGSQTVETYAESARRARENPLTLEQVDRLAAAAQEGNRWAAEKAVESVMGLILVDVFKTTRWRSVRDRARFEELLQAASLAAYESISRWDPEKGHFRTFSLSYAHFAAIKELSGGVTPVPVTMHPDLRRKAFGVLNGKMSFEETLTLKGISRKGLGHALRAVSATYDSIDRHEEARELALNLADDGSEKDFEEVFRRDFSMRFAQIVEQAELSTEDRYILFSTFGMEGYAVRTRIELSRELGIETSSFYRHFERLLDRVRLAAVVLAFFSSGETVPEPGRAA